MYLCVRGIYLASFYDFDIFDFEIVQRVCDFLVFQFNTTNYPALLQVFQLNGGFSGVRVTRSYVLCVCFVDRCLSFCTFSFGHCVVYSSSIYGF